MSKKIIETEKIISYLNYKDILIILFLWYFMTAIIFIFKEISFNHTFITSFFHFLFIISGRFIFLSLIILYLTSLYPIDFKQLGINFSKIKTQLIDSISKSLFLIIMLIIIINIPLTHLQNYNFKGLFMINSPEALIRLIIPFMLIFFACLFIAISEQFILNVIILELFNHTLFNFIVSLILTALFYSIILLNFIPSRIFINFIIAIISIIIYKKNDSIIASSIFVAVYYTSYISLIYGWEYLRF